MRKLIIALVIALFVFPCFARTYGPTKSTDHLWRVAIKVKPSKSVTVQQTMIAILKANPSAFLKYNINSIKSGYYLRIPSLKTIKSISPSKAVSMVHKQNKAWNKPQYKPKTVKTKTHKIADASKKQAEQNREIMELKKLEMQNQMKLVNLQTLIDKTNQTVTGLDQKYQQSMDTFTHNSDFLKTQVQQVEQKILTLQSTIQTVQKESKHNHSSLIWAMIIIGAFIVLIMLIILVVSRSKKTTPVTQTTQESEYDFMGSEESIPAKLDLAQTYIDMSDKKAANKVLEEVMQKGTDEQKNEAAKLLEQTK